MIKAIIDIFIAFVHLIETEARTLRRMLVNLGWGIAFIVIAAILVLASAGFFLWGLHQYFATMVSPMAAAFLVSLAALALAAIAGWLAYQRAR